MHSQDETNRYYVYALVDPVNRIPFYIGKGTGNRATHHLRPGHKDNKRKLTYIKSVRNLGLEPQIRFIGVRLLEKEAYAIEGCCIKIAMSMGFPLTNGMGVDPPNRTGKRMPDSAKIAISNYQRSRTNRPPVKDDIKSLLSQMNKGKSSYQSKIVQCPHCSKNGSNRAMYRWHFNECKQQRAKTRFV